MPDLDQINIPLELERLGVEFEYTSDNEVKVRCPAHDDSSASASLNIDKKVWKCHAAQCGEKGDFVSFMAHYLNCGRRVAWEQLNERYDLESDKTIDASLIEKYHQSIWDAPPLLKALRDRGLTDEDIRIHRLGAYRGRITIPVKNDAGRYVNIRRYMPGAPGADKMKNTRGHGQIRLYPIDQLKYDSIVLCGGECKAIAVASRLNELGIGAITATAGEGNWDHRFTDRFKDKKVWVCYDIDNPGKVAAQRVAAQLRGVSSWLGIVDLPLDKDKYPHGDVNDFLGAEGRSTEELLEVLNDTKAWDPPPAFEEETGPPTKIPFNEATHASHAGHRIHITGTVAAIDQNPYLVPRRVQVHCDRSQENCSVCPVFPMRPGEDEAWVELTVNKEAPALLEMVNAGDKTQKEAVRKALRIPPCKVVRFKAKTHYNIEEVRLTPMLDMSENTTEERMMTALSVSHGLQGNTAYNLVGRVWPHPRSQQATFLVSDSEPAVDSLSKFAPTASELQELSAFSPSEWSVDGISEVLAGVYRDLEANVTRIYQREQLHLAIDLVYHSPLVFDFDGRTTKGWVEGLVVGDSAQGKSETSMSLQRHYGLGEKVDAKNASVAGLLGGVQQLGSRWFVTWGKFPLNDRRLLILEELKGAPTEVIGALTDMRSSGVAEIQKIDKRKTMARTRLLAISNPRSDVPIGAYNYGVEVVRELIGGPEDIRRFDFAMLVSSDEVDPTELNKLQKHRPQVPHVHTSELCRRLVLWAWTRQREQVEFESEAVSAILEAATRLCSAYSDAVPLIDRGSIRLKLARLAASLAARTYSHEGELLLVRKCHVDFIVQWLDRLYSSDTFGYKDFSDAYESTRRLRDPDQVKKRVLMTPFPSDFVEQLIYATTVDLRDICDWCGWERGESNELLSFFVRKHALLRDGRVYRKSAAFIELLKTLRDSQELKDRDRPEHVKEDF